MSNAELPQIELASLSDVGRQRSANQDSYGQFTNPQGWRLLVVADGLGGHQGGETASRIAVETIQDVFERGGASPAEVLREAFQAANRCIYETASRTLELRGMGTTGVALLLDGAEAAWVAHVGDSRAYRLRDNVLEALTKDHSAATQLVEEAGMTPQEAQESPNSHVLLRAVGVEPEVEVEVKPVSLSPGDRFLLCSDGLWGEVPDADIAEVLVHHGPEDAVHILVAEANNHGGPDNITVQVAKISGTTEPTIEVSEEDAAPAPVVLPPRRARRYRATVTAAVLTALLIAALLWHLLNTQKVQIPWPTLPPVAAPVSPTEAPAESDVQQP